MLRRVIVCALATMTGTVALNAAEPAPRSALELRREIHRATAVPINPMILRAGQHVVVPAPAAQPAEEALPGAVSLPAPELAVVAPRLLKGQLFHVRLPAGQEAMTRQLLNEQLASISSTAATTLQTVDGVFRQLTSDNVEVQIKPFALVGQPLRYVPPERRFVGTVAVGAADVGDSGVPRTLSVPVVFENLATGKQVTLDRTSPPLGRFEVSSAASGEPVVLNILSNLSREGMGITVPVEPTLLVETDNRDLRGWGLQTTQVTVRAVGGAAIPEKRPVSLSAAGAFLMNSAPTFDKHGVAHAELRSDRNGQITVSATATGYVSGASDPLHVTWPWQTLLFALVGGLIGGFIRLGPQIRRGMNGLRFVVGLIIAVLTGLLIFVLYVLGVKLLPVAFAVEVGDLFALAAAALGGWLGSGVLPGLKASSKA
jgi:hypothetical protein